MLSLNVHHVEIYLPCNFEVNLITHLGVLKIDEKRAITPKWVIGFTSKLQGRKILICCNLNL
jgi:hypothetical protein